MTRVAAVDIGATSGRIMTAELDDAGIRLSEAARFPNRIIEADGRWTWDIDGLYGRVVDGLRLVGEVDSWGIDTWAVDYGVVHDGRRIGPVRAYRDPIHETGLARVDAVIPWARHYDIAGIQRMPINTVYQKIGRAHV